MQIDILRHLESLWQGQLRAGMSLTVWWVYRNDTDAPRWVNTLNRFGEFFLPDIRAHLIVAVIALYYPYDRTKGTDNFKRTLRLARSRKLPDAVLLKAKELVEEAEPIAQKVGLLRNKRFAHLASGASSDEVFDRASLSPNEMMWLLDRNFAVINLIRDAHEHWSESRTVGGTERHLRNVLERLERD